MSYDTEKIKLGRKPLTVCGLEMDFCSLTAGIAPCTATETGDDKCFNTRETCNDPANYTKTTKEYFFCQPRSSLPKGENMIPVIVGSPQKSPTSTTAGSGLGKRAIVKIKFRDFPHHDRGVDPYFSERTYTPEEQGTYWGKFISRNPYYEGRTLKLYYGYIGDTFSLANDFDLQEYDIIDIKGPDNGFIEITAKDVLVRTYENKAQYPVANTGNLLAGITDVATSATLTPTGIGNSEYAASGTLAIGKEVCTFTRAADVLTLTRAQWGTTAKSHNADDSVQESATWDGTNIIDVLDELLTTGAGLPSSFIPTLEWEAEKDLWLSSSNVKGILIKPESIEKVIGELSECFMFDIWWDATAQEVKIKALSPEPSGVTINILTEGINIKQDSLKIDRKSKGRFTEIRVFYNKLDYSEKNDPEQFKSLQISTDISRSGADRYNSNSIKTIMCRWFEAGANAAQLAGRLLARFSDTPEFITFKLDQKDEGDVVMAERIELNSWQFQDFNGANESRRYQILEINEGNDPGHDFTVKALTSSFVGRYFFVTLDSAPDYSAATDEQKESNGYISLSTGLFADGTDGHKII